MKLSEILSISGAPGLYKYVAQSKGGFIVESLDAAARRSNVSGSAKVSSLGDIAMYTYSEEVSLGEIFETIYKEFNGAAVAITSKSSAAQLSEFMEKALPEYDRDRVHNSDIKKLAQWYNILVAAGMSTFVEEEQEGEEAAETPKVGAQQAIKNTVNSAAVKNQGGAVSSKPKVAASKSTAARKAQ
ncbi:MAG: DUF5606 domain-containing protein [Rikenellaceae bacterium]